MRYNAKWASSKARRRKTMAMRDSHPCKLIYNNNRSLRQFVEHSLKLRWSPEQISLRLKYLESNLGSISHQAIYNYIYKNKREFIPCLRRRGKRRRQNRPLETYNQTNRTNHSIHNRPKIVDQLIRYGDLEGDTIVGKDKRDRLLTHNDRVTGLVSISLVHNFDAYNIMDQTTNDIKRVFNKIYTITYDNGIEFSMWDETEKRTGATIYFADPYTPGQRGRNENINGLIRDFFPKGADFKKLTQNDILMVESLLNNRPRKRLGGKTPIEASVALNHLT
ncbi:MAG: IS30 family transposase [Candidatus Saccharibacteria bacterium]|nr:IS30 family transposase [Candidatus Saccharibacteria bacterium]